MTYGRNNTEKAVYTYGEERIAEDDLQTDEAAEYLYDGRGSVVQTTIYTEVELSITYDPFGEITGGVDENFVGYAYNGEESSEVTGLQYLRARYYDTELGSFLTIDSYLGSLDDALSQNRYAYANNDPVNNIDPSGHYSVNVNGASQYYQSTGLNEIRDYMTASALWAGEVSAQNGYNNAVARANNTSFQNYASISSISQSTADSYINKGIAQAGQVSMNYGCSVPTVPNEAVAEFTDNVNDARESANAKIEDIKKSKKEQNDAYLEYLNWLYAQVRQEESIGRGISNTTSGTYENMDVQDVRDDLRESDRNSDWYGAAYLDRVSVTTIQDEIDLSIGFNLLKLSHTQTLTTTVTHGQEGEWIGAYAYTDVNLNGIDSNAGVGVDLWYVLGFDVNVKLLGIGATRSLNVGNYSIYANAEVDLFGDSTVSVGIVNTLENGDEINDQYAIKGNTYFVLCVVAAIMGAAQMDYNSAPNRIPAPSPVPNY